MTGYVEARERLSVMAAAYIAAADEFGLESPEAVTAYNAYDEQLKYFKVYDWL